MGIEYRLIKPVNKESFELGKGMWSKVFTIEYGIDVLLSDAYIWEEHLYYSIVKGIAWQFDKEIKLKYFYKLASDIYKWCGDDIIQFHDQDSYNELCWKPGYNHMVEYPYTRRQFKVVGDCDV